LKRLYYKRDEDAHLAAYSSPHSPDLSDDFTRIISRLSHSQSDDLVKYIRKKKACYDQTVMDIRNACVPVAFCRLLPDSLLAYEDIVKFMISRIEHVNPMQSRIKGVISKQDAMVVFRSCNGVQFRKRYNSVLMGAISLLVEFSAEKVRSLYLLSDDDDVSRQTQGFAYCNDKKDGEDKLKRKLFKMFINSNMGKDAPSLEVTQVVLCTFIEFFDFNDRDAWFKLMRTNEELAEAKKKKKQKPKILTIRFSTEGVRRMTDVLCLPFGETRELYASDRAPKHLKKKRDEVESALRLFEYDDWMTAYAAAMMAYVTSMPLISNVKGEASQELRRVLQSYDELDETCAFNAFNDDFWTPLPTTKSERQVQKRGSRSRE
jgi:hypothetical protein